MSASDDERCHILEDQNNIYDLWIDYNYHVTFNINHRVLYWWKVKLCTNKKPKGPPELWGIDENVVLFNLKSRVQVLDMEKILLGALFPNGPCNVYLNLIEIPMWTPNTRKEEEKKPKGPLHFPLMLSSHCHRHFGFNFLHTFLVLFLAKGFFRHQKCPT